MTNPFSKDYVPQLSIDHKDRKYKRPVLNQPPVNARAVLDHVNHERINQTMTERYRQVAQTKI
jgi:hypothetical protein